MKKIETANTIAILVFESVLHARFLVQKSPVNQIVV